MHLGIPTTRVLSSRSEPRCLWCVRDDIRCRELLPQHRLESCSRSNDQPKYLAQHLRYEKAAHTDQPRFCHTRVERIGILVIDIHAVQVVRLDKRRKVLRTRGRIDALRSRIIYQSRLISKPISSHQQGQKETHRSLQTRKP